MSQLFEGREATGRAAFPLAPVRAIPEWRGYAWSVMFLAGCCAAYLFILDLQRPALMVAVGGGALATLLSPTVGLYVLVASFPFAGLTLVVPGAFTLAKGIGILVGISTLLRVGRLKLQWIFGSRTFRVYLAILFWSLVLLPFTGNLRPALLAISVEVLMVGLCFAVVALVRTAADVQRLSLALAVGAAALAAYAAVAGFSDVMSRSGARLSAGMNENQIAAVLGTALLLSFVGLAARPPGAGLMWFVIIIDGLIMTALGFTFSRGAIVALMGAVVLGPVITRRLRLARRATIGGALLGLVLIGLATAYVRSPAVARQQLERRLTGEGESISGGRLSYIWPQKIRVFMEHPVTGTGPGGAITTARDAHNDFLFFLSERGLPGAVLFVLLLWAMLSDAQRAQRPGLRVTLVMLVLFTIAMGLTHTTFLSRSFALVVGIVSAVAVSGLSAQQARNGVGTSPWAYPVTPGTRSGGPVLPSPGAPESSGASA